MVIFDSMLHDVVMRFDSLLHFVANSQISLLQNVDGGGGDLAPMHFAAERVDYPLHNAAGYFCKKNH